MRQVIVFLDDEMANFNSLSKEDVECLVRELSKDLHNPLFLVFISGAENKKTQLPPWLHNDEHAYSIIDISQFMSQSDPFVKVKDKIKEIKSNCVITTRSGEDMDMIGLNEKGEAVKLSLPEKLKYYKFLTGENSDTDVIMQYEVSVQKSGFKL